MWYNSGVNHLPDNSLSCTPLSPITITYYGYYVTKQISAWHTSFKEQKWYYFFLLCDVLFLHDHLSPTLFWGQMGLLRRAMGQLCGPYYKELNVSPILLLTDLSEISRGEGVETEGGPQIFEPQKREGSWKMSCQKGEGHANICQWSCRSSPTEEKGSSLFGKK